MPATNLPLMISSRWIGWDDEAGQGPLGPLAVDGVEPEGDAEQRAEDPEELVERRHPLGRQGEQVEEDRRRLGRRSAASRIGPLAECTAASPASATRTTRMTNRAERT